MNGKPIPWQSVVAAIHAVQTEAARRGEMYPQTRDEQNEDKLAARRTAEMIEWYATKGGSVAEQLDSWPKSPEVPVDAAKDTERLNRLDEWASEGVVELGFELDGGVFCTLSPMGGIELSIREKNDVRELIDAAMAAKLVEELHTTFKEAGIVPSDRKDDGPWP